MTPSPSLQRSAPLWVLTGPTACGKTAVALELADRMRDTRPVEIVSIDSALIYRGMDIGTAKPTPAELARVPHHLIDIVDPQERYSAARFVADATQAIDSIQARGGTPLLVGGTMLYLKAMLEGMDEMPAIPPEVRTELDARMKTLGSAALHSELQQVDPTTAARLAQGDTQRIQRALEVFHGTGRPLSHYHQRLNEPRPNTPATLVSLEPAERTWLHGRIGKRFEQMMAQGFMQEVQHLRARGDLDAEMPSMRCVGYRQVWQALEEGLNLANPKVFASVTERGIAATRQLAKRQMTWLRSMPHRHVLDCSDRQGTSTLADAAWRVFTSSMTVEP
jgi:tRNA dimethylallyltransferase